MAVLKKDYRKRSILLEPDSKRLERHLQQSTDPQMKPSAQAIETARPFNEHLPLVNQFQDYLDGLCLV
jgi:hypothetical protein